MAHLSNVSLDFIRYANVWEDAQVLRRGLRIRPGERVLSIGSAGDNCFALLLDDPECVVAADVNPAQLHLIELKMAAIRALDYADLQGFLGFSEADDRLAVYDRQIAPQLSAAAQAFWSQKRPDVARGVIHTGKFEQYFQLFARRVLPLIHGAGMVEALLAPKSAAAQQNFYAERWNTWRWRALFKLFFSRFVMGRLGRDPAFLSEVKLQVGDYIFQKAAQQLSRVAAQHNPILRYNLTGSFGHLRPDYIANAENIACIRARLDRIRLFQGFVQDAGVPYGPFDAMNLSDIFEYMDEALFAQTGRALHQSSAPGCRIAYWNLMAPRRLSEILPEHFTFQEALSHQLTAVDRGFFYSKTLIDMRS
jgi:S-adenosylmethionine-diacylglycerol 3-amino-3-carboxypropyl transferase